jgi:predicted TPR repeat methyltransferase
MAPTIADLVAVCEYLAETAAMHPSAAEIMGLYERHARAFDAERARSLFERGWLDFFRSVAGPAASVLDLGCGMGEPMARNLIESAHPVTGVDSAPAMIALCRERFPSETWIVADMRELNLGARFGGILAWDSFFHLTPEDQRAMFAVFRRHAARGAALMFTSGPLCGEAIGSFRGEALYHASLDADEYMALLNAHGFEIVAHVVEDATCGGHTVWLSRSTKGLEATGNAA